MKRNNKRHPVNGSASQNVYATPGFQEARRENLLRRQKKNTVADKVKRPAPPVSGRNRERALVTAWPFAFIQPWRVRTHGMSDDGAAALIRRIAEIICYVKTLNYSKQYMQDALAVILKHYTGSKDISSMAGINRAIASELAKYGGYQLSSTELKTIWMM